MFLFVLFCSLLFGHCSCELLALRLQINAKELPTTVNLDSRLDVVVVHVYRLYSNLFWSELLTSQTEHNAVQFGKCLVLRLGGTYSHEIRQTQQIDIQLKWYSNKFRSKPMPSVHNGPNNLIKLFNIRIFEPNLEALHEIYLGTGRRNTALSGHVNFGPEIDENIYHMAFYIAKEEIVPSQNQPKERHPVGHFIVPSNLCQKNGQELEETEHRGKKKIAFPFEFKVNLDNLYGYKLHNIQANFHQLETFEKAQNQQKAERQKCAICLKPLKKKQKITTLHVQHSFHTDCILKWIGDRATIKCPLCNLELPPYKVLNMALTFSESDLYFDALAKLVRISGDNRIAFRRRQAEHWLAHIRQQMDTKEAEIKEHLLSLDIKPIQMQSGDGGGGGVGWSALKSWKQWRCYLIQMRNLFDFARGAVEPGEWVTQAKVKLRQMLAESSSGEPTQKELANTVLALIEETEQMPETGAQEALESLRIVAEKMPEP
uniref:RING-type domain-containing protein n=1 Tax=Globodera pallida TaxID=36090 RepID=A0A183CDP0_GLOPA